MIFLAVIVALGLIRKKGSVYWQHCFIAFIIQSVTSLLFHANTGLFGPFIYKDLSGAALVMAMGLVMAIGWGLPIYFVRRGLKA